MIIYQKKIERTDLKQNPEVTYVFGDNADRKGFGGQAQAMRGEKNALGIVTKRKATYDRDAFYYDRDYDLWLEESAEDFETLRVLVEINSTIVFPSDGIGTGRANLPVTAPLIFDTLGRKLMILGIENTTWL